MSGSILCLGEAVIDFIPVGEETAYRPCPGGSSYNVARALGRLGIPAEYGRAISTDLFGDQLAEGLAQSRVGQRFLARIDAPSTLGFVSLVQAEPAYAFFDREAADRICVEMPPASMLAGIDALHFGSIALIREPAASAYEALFLREAGGPRLVSFDPNIRASHVRDEHAYRARLERLLRCADIIKISGADLDWLQPGVDHDEAARTWIAGGAGLVVITHGKAGVSGWTRESQAHARALDVAVVDTVGAGDSFMAGLLAGLYEAGCLKRTVLTGLKPEVLHEVLAYGQRVASTTCTRRGADSPWRHELGPD